MRVSDSKMVLCLQLSISEYRQRKQREGGEKGDGSEGTTSPTSQDDERPSSAGASPSDPLLEINDIKTGQLIFKPEVPLCFIIYNLLSSICDVFLVT